MRTIFYSYHSTIASMKYVSSFTPIQLTVRERSSIVFFHPGPVLCGCRPSNVCGCGRHPWHAFRPWCSDGSSGCRRPHLSWWSSRWLDGSSRNASIGPFPLTSVGKERHLETRVYSIPDLRVGYYWPFARSRGCGLVVNSPQAHLP